MTALPGALRPVCALVAATLTLGTAAACGGGDDDNDDHASDVTLVVYSGLDEEFGKKLTDAFSAQAGVSVDLRSGDGMDLSGQIASGETGDDADVYLSAEPGTIDQLDAAGLLATVSDTVLGKVDDRFSPSNGDWLGFSASSRAIYYNPDKIAEADLPTSIMELADPAWKDRFAFSTDGAFACTVAYLVDRIGADQTQAWLSGLVANGQRLDDDAAVRDAVESGEVDFGLSDHGAWFDLAADKGGPDAMTSKVAYLGNGDPGSLMFATGAGIFKSSEHSEWAQGFLDWLATSTGGQKVVASESSLYPLASGVESDAGLTPLAELTPPAFDQGSLTDMSRARQVLTDAGLG